MVYILLQRITEILFSVKYIDHGDDPYVKLLKYRSVKIYGCIRYDDIVFVFHETFLPFY